jgi:hypothetical protein
MLGVTDDKLYVFLQAGVVQGVMSIKRHMLSSSALLRNSMHSLQRPRRTHL